MFCGKCGTQIPDNAGFCPSCGNVIGAQTAETTQTVTEAPKKKVNTKAIIGIAAAVVVVALAVVLICVFAGGGAGGSGSPETVVENYLDSYLSYDVDGMLSCFHDDVLDVVSDGDIDELKEQLESMCDSMKEYREESDLQMSFEIIDTVDLKDEDLEDIKEEFIEEADIEVSAAAEVTVELFTKGEADGEEIDQSDSTDAIVVKIDGKWYLHPDFLM